ncbi:MAG: hypothetical protein DHS80DRAFT_32096 [Piptocephalis tieghemiana]|nr:MAG: hypothetical protein DHS80DRAFT_32096 [Piptocephalis tieghemiana]
MSLPLTQLILHASPPSTSFAETQKDPDDPDYPGLSSSAKDYLSQLPQLLDQIHSHLTSPDHLDDSTLVQLLTLCGKLDRPQDPWSSPAIAAQSHCILQALIPPSSFSSSSSSSSSISSFVAPYLEPILTHSLRPAFRHSLHPAVHPHTARPSPWPKEKPSTFGMNQDWKDRYPGTTSLLEWVARHITTSKELESHLGSLLPMILTLLDDWEARGLDLLFLHSLHAISTYRSGSIHGPKILQHSVSLSLHLLEHTRPLRSEATWYHELHALYHRAILDNALFIGPDPLAQQALLHAMHQLITTMGLSSVKYARSSLTLLKDILDLPIRPEASSIDLLTSLFTTLNSLLQVGYPRLPIYAPELFHLLSRGWFLVSKIQATSSCASIRPILLRTSFLLRSLLPDLWSDAMDEACRIHPALFTPLVQDTLPAS